MNTIAFRGDNVGSRELSLSIVLVAVRTEAVRNVTEAI